jgi:predicted dehydrogenase/aryl-alcohol dehydrogenase-like predicted oxidoreductase
MCKTRPGRAANPAKPTASLSVSTTMTDQPVRWGIIGPGTIARTFASNIPHSADAKLVAVATRNPEKPGLAEGFPGARVLKGYEALIADREVDAIYVATPHPGHAEWAIRAAEAGKHVLCEKPLGISAHEAEAMIHAARKAGTFLGEAYMYRLHPLTLRLLDIVRSGAIGEVRGINASFGFRMGNPDPKHRLLANDTAGGGILDICGYPVSMARLIAGAAEGKPFAEPAKVAGAARLGATGVDEWASAVLQFPSGIIAEVAGGISLAYSSTVRVFGTAGWLEVMSPWFATGRQGGATDIVIHRPNAADETIHVEEKRWLYTFEIDAVGRAIRTGKQEFDPPGMTWSDSLGNMRVLDKWRASVGLVFDIERTARRPTKLDGRPLKKPAKPMRRVKIPGISKEVSAVALGAVGLETPAHAAIMLDTFYERGGTLVDTAWNYFAGRADRVVGDWLDARGVREEMVVLAKGLHTPLTYPDVIARQLTDSLERLKTGYADLYIMHRDNIDVPVGEFVDAMDREVKAGRIRVWGGSNWTRERMDAAIDYAKQNGKTPPGALSNNFSLAEMVEAPWAGCLASSDEAWTDWLRKRHIPLFAWSSQAQGFFTDRAGRDKHDDPALARSWYSGLNFGRRDRAAELAKKLGKTRTQVALAYCLWQDFTVVPLIGPLTTQELEDSLEALSITLSPEDVRWLAWGDEGKRAAAE